MNRKIGWAALLPIIAMPTRLWLTIQNAKKHLATFTHPEVGPYHFDGPSEAVRITMFGDSLGVGVGANLSQSLPWRIAEQLAETHGVTLRIRAVSGSRGRDIVANQLPEGIADEPHVAIFCVGTNDVADLVFWKSRFADVCGEYRELMETIRARLPNTTAIITGAADVGSLPKLGRIMRYTCDQKARKLNRMIEELADEFGFDYVPLAKLVSDEFRSNPALFSVDNFHLSPDGQMVLAATLTPFVRSAAPQ